MKLYSNKFRWKLVLFGTVLLFIVVSLFYSNSLIQKIHKRETEKAKQWAQTIRKKGELVSLTNQIFKELRDKEKQQARLVLDALSLTLRKTENLSNNVDVAFAQKVLKSNLTIPMALLIDNEIAQSQNLDSILANNEKTNVFIEDCRKSQRTQVVEISDNFFIEFIFGESRELIRLNAESDSLLNSFNQELLNNDHLIPLILIDEKTGKVETTNISSSEWSEAGLQNFLKEFSYKPIQFNFGSGNKLLYFKDSKEVTYLKWYPAVQFFLIGLIVFIAYIIFSTYRKAEQNQVWAGMAKETAHQLGTPLSSLMAWLQHLENEGVDKMTTDEMTKDLDRLSKITDRFSKIGSDAKLESSSINETILNSIEYLKTRFSKKIEIHFSHMNSNVMVHHNIQLLEWVIENIFKNAVDSMDGVGTIEIALTNNSSSVFIDISDTGKGLARTQFKTVFEPGYSTKKRGWGLGLTLVKRIVEEYHLGKVFVHKSELKKGTTFRIMLRK